MGLRGLNDRVVENDMDKRMETLGVCRGVYIKRGFDIPIL